MKLPPQILKTWTKAVSNASRFQYEAEKWTNLFLYGTNGQKNTAQVAFMLTHDMKTQLLQRNFPQHVITNLKPAHVQELLQNNTNFSEYQQQILSQKLNKRKAQQQIQHDVIQTPQTK